MNDVQDKTSSDVQELVLTAADGYPISATRYQAKGTLRGQLVMAGATGVPQGFYRRFAEFARATTS